jgi:hypothetical protein
MENHHFSWENPLSMAIFNSYVKLPEGKQIRKEQNKRTPIGTSPIQKIDGCAKISGFCMENHQTIYTKAIL